MYILHRSSVTDSHNNLRTLEEYFYESCIRPEGDDIDDEDFRIKINFKLFEKPAYANDEKLEVTKACSLDIGVESCLKSFYFLH